MHFPSGSRARISNTLPLGSTCFTSDRTRSTEYVGTRPCFGEHILQLRVVLVGERGSCDSSMVTPLFSALRMQRRQALSIPLNNSSSDLVRSVRYEP